MSIIRRRGMLREASGGPSSVVVLQNTSTSQSGTHRLPAFTADIVNAYNEKQPDRMIYRIYAVPPSGTAEGATASARFAIWNSAGYAAKMLSGSSSSSALNYKFGDGTEITTEVIFTKTGTKKYSFVTTTNAGGSYSSSYTFNMDTTLYLRGSNSSPQFGVGTHSELIFEYDE